MATPQRHIAQAILDQSLGYVLATDLFVNEMPDDKDACVCVRRGVGGDRDHGDLAYTRPGVQIIVRDRKGNEEQTDADAQTIADVLCEDGAANNTTYDGYRIIGIWQQGDLLSAGPDRNGRPLTTINLSVHRTPTS